MYTNKPTLAFSCTKFADDDRKRNIRTMNARHRKQAMASFRSNSIYRQEEPIGSA